MNDKKIFNIPLYIVAALLITTFVIAGTNQSLDLRSKATGEPYPIPTTYQFQTPTPILPSPSPTSRPTPTQTPITSPTIRPTNIPTPTSFPEVIFQNIGDSKYPNGRNCQNICMSHFMNCKSIGTDDNATNNRIYSWNSNLFCFQGFGHNCYSVVKYIKSSISCGGKQTEWTNCRCK
jgi:hypothetical protein